MIKMLTLLKRHPSMTVQEFREYYETRHRVIGEKVLKPHASRYMRRYLDPLPNPITGQVDEPEHDVAMEIWFEDQAQFDAAMASITQPENMKMIEEDEEIVFDRPKFRAFLLTECESDMSA